MKLAFLLIGQNIRMYHSIRLHMVNPERIIQRIDFPDCKSCVYFQPRDSDSEFANKFSRCNKFGKKNLITGEIDYNYADLNRNDETKCGEKGRYYIEEPNYIWKRFKHEKKAFVFFLFLFVGASFLLRN